MNDARLVELTARFLDADLTDDDERELAAAVAADPALRARLRSALVFDAQLRAAVLGPSGDGFVRAVRERIRAAGTTDRLRRRIVERIAAGDRAGRAQRRSRRRPRRSSLAVLVPAFGVLLTAAAALLLVLLPHAGEPSADPAVGDLVIVEASGPVRVQRDGSSTSVLAGERLAPGERLETGNAGRAVLGRGGDRIEVAAATRIAAAPGAGALVRLESGTIACRVEPLPGRQRFAIATPHAEVAVLGTVFRVEVGTAQTVVSVSSGTVAVATAAGDVTEVGSDEAVLVDAAGVRGYGAEPDRGLLARWVFGGGPTGGGGIRWDPAAAERLSCDGVDGVLVSGDLARLRWTDAFTVAFRLRIDGAPAEGGEELVQLGGWAVRVRPADDAQHLELLAHGAIMAAAEVPTGRWTQLCAVFSPGLLTVFQDGRIVSERELPRIAGGTAPSQALAIPFPGRIDDVRIYDRALDEAEVRRLAAVGR